jgi:glycosyltransferase involved in cell wall biosynthesis
MKILVSVISYNEESNIEATLRDLIDHNFGYDIVVIDNGSRDGTQLICSRIGIPTVRHCVNTGSSVGTLISYFSYAYARGYDVLCQFDGDGQHAAEELPKILAPIAAGEADCVIGSRFLERSGFQSTFFRRLGIRLFSRLFTLVTGQKLTDITSGFRSYDKNVIAFFGHTYRDPIYDSMNQFLLLTFFAGFRIREVPVVMHARRFGVSEFDFMNALAFPLKGLVSFAACLLQRGRVTSIRS